MAPWQLKLVKEIHLFTQMFWLEGWFKRLCDAEFMVNIERLKITIQRRDWWWNENNTPLYINPKGHPKHHVNSPEQMLAMIKGEKIAKQEGRKLEPFLEDSWGSVFKKLPSLKELKFEFETSDDKKAELETIVDWAKTWRFPMNDGMVLSADNSVVKRSTWVGPKSFWSKRCPYCGDQSMICYGLGVEDPNPGCLERRERISLDEGPTLHVMSLRWKLAKDLEDEKE